MNIKWKEEMHMDGHPEIFSGSLHAKFLGVPLHYDHKYKPGCAQWGIITHISVMLTFSFALE